MKPEDNNARTDLQAITPEQELRYIWKSKVAPLCNEIRNGLGVSEGRVFMRAFHACDQMIEIICEWRQTRERKTDSQV